MLPFLGVSSLHFFFRLNRMTLTPKKATATITPTVRPTIIPVSDALYVLEIVVAYVFISSEIDEPVHKLYEYCQFINYNLPNKFHSKYN